MSVDMIRDVLLWCGVINMGILLWWWLVRAGLSFLMRYAISSSM